MNLTQVTINLIKAREALAEAEKAEAQAVAELKAAYAEAGITFNVVDGQKVTVERKGRTTYNAETLIDMVSAVAFKKVTKAVVDSKKFKSACEMGVIKPEVAEAVTTVTEYESVRVTDLAKDKADKATDKIYATA